MKLWLVCYGEIEVNVVGLYSGYVLMFLMLCGVVQVCVFGEWLCLVFFDKVFCSELVWIGIMVDLLFGDCVILCECYFVFNEMFFGDWEMCYYCDFQ